VLRLGYGFAGDAHVRPQSQFDYCPWRPTSGFRPTERNGIVAAIASKAAWVMAMRIIKTVRRSS
jgi:hypothetical protein